MVIEDTPRLALAQLKALTFWPRIREAGWVRVRLELDGVDVSARIEIQFDRTPFGARAWLKCPICGSRRVHLYLKENGLGCRGCLRGLYFEQALAASHWKHEIAVPALRAFRRCPRADSSQPATNAA